MSCTLGLWIGKSFVEACAYKAGAPSPVAQSRWFLPKKSLTDGIREILKGLQESNGGRIYIASSRTEQALLRKQGQAPALLITQGFEAWPQLVRSELSIPSNLIFPVKERTLASGANQTPCQMDELETIAAQLKQLSVQDVVVCFLNSTKNPDNETRAAHFLRERGFRVQASHSLSTDFSLDENRRWLKTAQAAYAEATVSEERTELATLLEAELGINLALGNEASTQGDSPWSVKVWGPSGLLPFSQYTANQIHGGSDSALSRWFEHVRAQAGHHSVLHFGLDDFRLFSPEGSQTLDIRATQQIGVSAWSAPTYLDEDKGYEPGPMLFGKSHQLSLLDILFVRNRLETIEALSSLISDRTRPRILETLFTLGKSIPTSSGPADAKDIAEDLETFCIEKISTELALNDTKGSVLLTGSLAGAFAPLLQRRRPDLSFELDPNAAVSQAAAVADGSVIEDANENRRTK